MAWDNGSVEIVPNRLCLMSVCSHRRFAKNTGVLTTPLAVVRNCCLEELYFHITVVDNFSSEGQEQRV